MHNNKDIDFQHDAEVKVNAIGSFKFYNLNVGHVKTPNKALFWPQIQYKYTLSQSIDFISPNSSLKNFIPQQIFGSFYTKYNATKINSYAVSSNSLRYIIDKKNHTINYTTPIIWSPLGCLPSLSSAIIIPYRKREQHLRVLTDHLHGFLRHQRIPYTIFIIEQTGETKFNRGALLNAGFLEVSKFKEYDCFILHDVDKLPEDDRIIYTCGPNPTHLSASLSTFNYKRDEFKVKSVRNVATLQVDGWDAVRLIQILDCIKLIDQSGCTLHSSTQPTESTFWHTVNCCSLFTFTVN
ncbi:unnamed protein product [Schistosoma mattheei]|uniref:Uncharacterized protein n=1 Tax=Schistosoma mattheei TaxID=31246 RepID=A0A183PM64_9TREM|nr:unnamed protein product [Schistosoma mattheei]